MCELDSQTLKDLNEAFILLINMTMPLGIFIGFLLRPFILDIINFFFYPFFKRLRYFINLKAKEKMKCQSKPL